MSFVDHGRVEVPRKRPTPRMALDELMCVSEDGGRLPGVALELDAGDFDLRPFADVENDLGVRGLIAADQLTAGEGPAVLVELLDEGEAGGLVRHGVERHAGVQAGDLVDVVVGAAEVLGAVVDDVLDEVGLVLDGEDDGDLAVRFGTIVGFDVGELARGDEGAHVLLDGFRAVGKAGPRLDLGHNLLGGDQPVALDEYVGDHDPAGRGERRLGEAGQAAQEHAQHGAGGARLAGKSDPSLAWVGPCDPGTNPTFAQGRETDSREARLLSRRD